MEYALLLHGQVLRLMEEQLGLSKMHPDLPATDKTVEAYLLFPVDQGHSD